MTELPAETAMPEPGEAEWKNYDDFAAGINTNRLPRTDVLAGRTLDLSLADGSRLALSPTARDRLDWQGSGLVEGDGTGEEYEALEVDDDVYFLDVTFAARPRDALTLIVDLGTGHVLAILSHVAEEHVPGEPQVGQTFVAGWVGDARPNGPAPAPTRDLIGRRILYRYSPNHLYEHVYLSSTRYAWQCLQGVQRGHGDCDLATTYRFKDGRYVFTFREFRIPVASTFFYNFDQLRSTGKFLGLTGDGRIENTQAGAVILPLSETAYPEGLEPV